MNFLTYYKGADKDLSILSINFFFALIIASVPKIVEKFCNTIISENPASAKNINIPYLVCFYPQVACPQQAYQI